MLNIGIITGNLKRNATGMGAYAFNIIEGLMENNQINIIRHKEGDGLSGCNSVTPYYPPVPFWYFAWSNLLNFHKREFKNLDLVHNATQYPISASIAPCYIITIHDLIPLLYPSLVTPFYAAQSKWLLPIILKKATRIIAVSQSTKDDIVKLIKINPEKIDVVHHGVSNHFRIPEPDEIQAFKKRYNLNFPFILFVGALEPKKNIPNLIKAFNLCLQEEPSLKLVIAGKKSWKYEIIFSTIESLNLKSKVIFFDFFPYEELPLLYSAAEVFVFPSIYEGFGFPPLEAMKCGTPVIVSNRSSLPEIVGSQGLMVNPNDIRELSTMILNVISEPNFKKNISEYYLKRSGLFTWERCIEETMKSYERALLIKSDSIKEY